MGQQTGGNAVSVKGSCSSSFAKTTFLPLSTNTTELLCLGSCQACPGAVSPVVASKGEGANLTYTGAVSVLF